MTSGGIDVAFCQREQTLLDRQHLGDQLRAREWGTARAGDRHGSDATAETAAAAASGPRDRSAWLPPLSPGPAHSGDCAGNAPNRIGDGRRDTSGTSTIGRCPGRRQRPCRASAAGRRLHARWRWYRTHRLGRRVSRASVVAPFVRWPVSSALRTGWFASACRSALYGAATAALASSHACCVLPRLSGICKTSASNRCTTRRGKRQTTVRYAISAASCGPNCPAPASGTAATVRVPQAGQCRR